MRKKVLQSISSFCPDALSFVYLLKISFWSNTIAVGRSEEKIRNRKKQTCLPRLLLHSKVEKSGTYKTAISIVITIKNGRKSGLEFPIAKHAKQHDVTMVESANEVTLPRTTSMDLSSMETPKCSKDYKASEQSGYPHDLLCNCYCCLTDEKNCICARMDHPTDRHPISKHNRMDQPLRKYDREC